MNGTKFWPRFLKTTSPHVTNSPDPHFIKNNLTIVLELWIFREFRNPFNQSSLLHILTVILKKKKKMIGLGNLIPINIFTWMKIMWKTFTANSFLWKVQLKLQFGRKTKKLKDCHDMSSTSQIMIHLRHHQQQTEIILFLNHAYLNRKSFDSIQTQETENTRQNWRKHKDM